MQVHELKNILLVLLCDQSGGSSESWIGSPLVNRKITRPSAAMQAKRAMSEEIARPDGRCANKMPSLSKPDLRKALRRTRHAHVEAQPETIKALLFHRPPGALLSRISEDATIGLYAEGADEAPAAGYAKFFHEQGRTIALPQFDARDAPMGFARFSDPFDEDALEIGPYGVLQPGADAAPVVPDVVFVPLIGFTAEGYRLGQGGGHYDRWFSEHPGRLAIGLAWDVQLCEVLPTEPHDITLDGVITPTRSYGL